MENDTGGMVGMLKKIAYLMLAIPILSGHTPAFSKPISKHSFSSLMIKTLELTTNKSIEDIRSPHERSRRRQFSTERSLCG